MRVLRRTPGHPDEWRTQGACQGQDPLLFWPDDERGKTREHINKQAKSICSECDVLHKCFAWAIRNERYGTWGGHTEEERSKIRRKAGAAA